MSDEGELWRDVREARANTRALHVVPCPECRRLLPKASPSMLLPQQRCGQHGYRDPRPRAIELDQPIMPKPFRGKPATVTRLHSASPAQAPAQNSEPAQAPNHVLGASGAMRRAAPPRPPVPSWPKTQPPAMVADRRMRAADLAERQAERDAANARLIAERMEHERDALPATDKGSYRTLALITLAVAAAWGVALWVLS